MNIDYNKITNVEIEDIFRFDYPDFYDFMLLRLRWKTNE